LGAHGRTLFLLHRAPRPRGRIADLPQPAKAARSG
jgi:hypothetical protein